MLIMASRCFGARIEAVAQRVRGRRGCAGAVISITFICAGMSAWSRRAAPVVWDSDRACLARGATVSDRADMAAVSLRTAEHWAALGGCWRSSFAPPVYD
jgi:hypothetical protein